MPSSGTWRWLALALFLLVASWVTASVLDQGSHADELPAKYRKPPPVQNCESDTVTVVMNGIEFLVPRRTVDYKTADGDAVFHVDSNHPSRHCDINRIVDVVYFLTNGRFGDKSFRVLYSDPESLKNNKYSTSYQIHQPTLTKGLRDGEVRMLDENVKKVKYRQVEMYLFPQDKAETGNDQPVLLQCSPFKEGDLSSNCYTLFVLPENGFRVQYHFLRRSVPESEYLKYHLSILERYQGMKAN